MGMPQPYYPSRLFDGSDGVRITEHYAVPMLPGLGSLGYLYGRTGEIPVVESKRPWCRPKRKASRWSRQRARKRSYK